MSNQSSNSKPPEKPRVLIGDTAQITSDVELFKKLHSDVWSDYLARIIGKQCEVIALFRGGDVKIRCENDVYVVDIAVLTRIPSAEELAEAIQTATKYCEICCEQKKVHHRWKCQHESCRECSYRMYECPMCRLPITQRLRIPLSEYENANAST